MVRELDETKSGKFLFILRLLLGEILHDTGAWLGKFIDFKPHN